VATTPEECHALAKHHDYKPKSGQVIWKEFRVTGVEGGPFEKPKL